MNMNNDVICFGIVIVTLIFKIFGEQYLDVALGCEHCIQH